MTTSKRDASKASKLLKSKAAPKAVKSVAGSDLAQAKRKKSNRKRQSPPRRANDRLGG